MISCYNVIVPFWNYLNLIKYQFKNFYFRFWVKHKMYWSCKDVKVFKFVHAYLFFGSKCCINVVLWESKKTIFPSLININIGLFINIYVVKKWTFLKLNNFFKKSRSNLYWVKILNKILYMCLRDFIKIQQFVL